VPKYKLIGGTSGFESTVDAVNKFLEEHPGADAVAWPSISGGGTLNHGIRDGSLYAVVRLPD